MPANNPPMRSLKQSSEVPLATGSASSKAAAAPQMAKDTLKSDFPGVNSSAINPINAVKEKRGNPRYKCEGSAEFRTEGFDVRTWARITDISRSGCYVEMQATSPLNTPVNLLIEIKGMRFHAKGIVKTSYSLQGMGILFTEILDVDCVQLEEILRQLSRESSPGPEPKPSAGPDLLMITNVSAALNAVAKFFQTNRSLTRDEFTDLIGKSQNQNGGRQS